MKSFETHFSRFLSAAPGRLHFAAHSHHPWPDVTFAAHQQAWLDAAAHADDKWELVFGQVLPRAQRGIARELELPEPGTLVFAPNTHELVVRLLSCLGERPRVVTTDSEFHSLERQLRRLEEEQLVDVERVPSAPFDTFPERLVAAVKRAPCDLVFFSHVFFNSGAVVPELEGVVGALPPDVLVVVDGYHGFCAVPTSWARLASRACYLAGGYKYAMGGEGACFLHVPPGLSLRPRNTGWFAAFGALEAPARGQVPFASGAAAMMGATFDPSGVYRLGAALDFREAAGCTTAVVRAHARDLQARLVARLPDGPVRAEHLVLPLEAPQRGQFLTFRTPRARELSASLKALGVVTDARDDRLRFGFGPYQTSADVDGLAARLADLK